MPLDEENSLSIEIVTKMPKTANSGRFFLYLAYLLSIEVRPLGMLRGDDSDKFNWFSVRLTGQMERLVASLVYLNNHDLGAGFLRYE
jgi:hypothetical protein